MLYSDFALRSLFSVCVESINDTVRSTICVRLGHGQTSRVHMDGGVLVLHFDRTPRRRSDNPTTTTDDDSDDSDDSNDTTCTGKCFDAQTHIHHTRKHLASVRVSMPSAERTQLTCGWYAVRAKRSCANSARNEQAHLAQRSHIHNRQDNRMLSPHSLIILLLSASSAQHSRVPTTVPSAVRMMLFSRPRPLFRSCRSRSALVLCKRFVCLPLRTSCARFPVVICVRLGNYFTGASRFASGAHVYDCLIRIFPVESWLQPISTAHAHKGS